jgi:hypothetical protein
MFTGALTASSTLFVTGAATLYSTLSSLTHTPAATLTSDLGSASLRWNNLYAGAIYATSSVITNGSSTGYTATNLYSTTANLATINSSTAINASGTLSATGATNLYSTLNVVATSTLATTTATTLAVSGALNASSTLAVTGVSTFYGTANHAADILPTTDASRSIGSASLRFLNTYSQNLFASSSVITNGSSTGYTATNLYSTTANLGAVTGTTGMFTGALTASSTLFVTGATTLYSTLSSLTHTPAATLTSDLGSASLRWNNLYAGAIYASSSVITNGSSTGYTATNLYSTTANLATINSSTAINASGTLSATGATSLYGALNAFGAVNASSTLGVTGATTLYSTLNVRATSTLATTTATTLAVTGELNASSTFNLTGAANFYSTLSSLTHTPRATLTSDLGSASLRWNNLYAGAIYASSSVITNGSSTGYTTTNLYSTTANLATINSSTAINASGTLAVTGQSTFYSTINTAADILPTTTNTRSLGTNALRFLNTYSQNLFASSSVITNGSSTGYTATNLYSTTANLATINSSTAINASGTLSATGATTLYSTLKVNGAISASSTLAVTGTTTLYSALNVSATSTLASTTITSLSVSGAASITGTTTMAGGLTVTSFSGGSWINLPTTGPSGIGTGGAGANPFIAYVQGGGQWFTNAVAGDIAYRNTTGKLLFGNTSGNASMILSSDRLGLGTTSPMATLDVYGSAILEGSDRYLNFGTATSSSGYGFRDNAGVMEIKNALGDWTQMASTTLLSTITTATTSTSSASGLQVYSDGTLGMLRGCSNGEVLRWATTTSKWECHRGTDAVNKVKSANENVPSGTTLQSDDELFFSVGAGETWVYKFELLVDNNNSGTPDWKSAILGAAGWTCYNLQYGTEADGADWVPVEGTDCDNAPTAMVNAAVTADAEAYTVVIQGRITTTSAGTVNLQWAPNTSGSLSVFAGSRVTAQKVGGVDLAEMYYTTDLSMKPGTVVSLDSTITAGVKKSTGAYDKNAFGIISTKPGLLLGDGVSNSTNASVNVALPTYLNNLYL